MGLYRIDGLAWAHIGPIESIDGLTGASATSYFTRQPRHSRATSVLHLKHFPLLDMSTFSIGNALDFKDLTQDEQILHHNAAMVKKDLQVYLASPTRDEGIWTGKFIKHLVFPKFLILPL